MKTLQAFILFLFFVTCGYSQIRIDKVIERQQKKTERKIENRIEKKIDKGVDKALDKTEEGIEESVKGGSEEKETAASKSETSKGSSSSKAAQENVAEATATAKPVLSWNKYDFVPGTEIIFEDNQEGEQNGEFPSKWDLFEGTIENANLDGQNVIYFIKCNTNGGGGIVPLLKNNKEDYLPEDFTFEFDAYFEVSSSSYTVHLLDCKNQKGERYRDFANIDFSKNGARIPGGDMTLYPGSKGASYDKTAKWRHFAVSFNKRALKVYVDDARVLNIPNVERNPTGITLGYHNPSSTTKGYIKNVRIAKGAVPLYDKLLTDGKFVTTGIKFDVNKATIKPESMGTINYVLKMLTDHPELKFSVEGHTDNDGDEALNQKLSEARAKSVVDKLIELGVAKDRFNSKGWGEAKPIRGNDTSEGKALNRRVEFVKI